MKPDWSITHSDQRCVCQLAMYKAYGYAYGTYFRSTGFYQVGNDTFHLKDLGYGWRVTFWRNRCPVQHIPIGNYFDVKERV